jgi:surface protein
MFVSCGNMTSLDMSGFKTDSIINMSQMFMFCSNLTNINMSGFRTNKVTEMNNMFLHCRSLKTIFVGDGWSNQAVTNSDGMFFGCTNLVGGAGTAYDRDHTDHTYAHIDGGPDNPGYFTRSGDAPYTEPELYAVLEENMNANSMVDAAPNRAATAKTYTMKFYYDGKKTERNGMSVETYREATTREWDNMAESITNVVFDLTVVNDTAITSTGYWFSGFTQLTSIEGLNYLNTSHVADTWAMFEKCSSLKEVNLSNFDTRNVKTMGLMFYGCENLLNLDVSSFNTANVTHTNSMFANCIGLTSLDLSGFNTRKVENMSEMFLNCTHLTTIYAGSDWSTESSAGGGKMFGSCYSLVGGMGTTYDENHVDGTYAHIDGGPDNPGYLTDIADTVTVDDDIIQFADANVKAICVSNWDASGDGELSKTEAAAVTTIGTIFKGNTTIGSFNELKYFTGLESLSNSAFEKSTVTSLELPDGLREIGSDAFSQCRQLKSIYIPATVSKMGSDRGMAEFWLCYNLETIVVDENNKFYTSVDNVLFNKEMTKIIRYPAAKPDAAYEIPNTVSAINQNCFESCSYLMAVYIPASVNEMGYGAFQQCSKLVKVTISDGVTMIGEDAFRSCESLDRIHIPASVKQIGDERNSPENVFFWSSALAEITVDENNPYFMSEGGILYSRDKSIIVAYPPALTASEFAVPYGVQKISSCCFTGTKNLTSIQIPETVIAYGSAAINLSDNTLQSLTVMATTPATIEDYAFSDAAYSATLYVPVGTVQAYRNANGWKLFQNIVEQSNVPVDYSFDYNGVLTVGGSATLADALSAAGGREEVAKTISAIVWNSTASLTNSDLQGLDNPNMLIYVYNGTQAPDRNNVIIDGRAKNIVLTDAKEGNNNFYCPQAFTAEKVTYTRNFQQQTQVGVSRGWESIALPFTVQTISHESQGTIAPFGNSASGKHFWLRRLGDNGLTQATKMEANVPYLISMPNNSEAYYAEYNLSGKVTFTAQDVTVPVTASVTLARADSTIKMVPAFQSIGRSSDVWAINVGETRGQYYEGSVFERDYREVRPFEAYTIHRSDTPAPRFVPVNTLMGGTTGIEDVIELMSDDRGEGTWHDLQGRKVANGKLPRGVYIRNGKKTVVR